MVLPKIIMESYLWDAARDGDIETVTRLLNEHGVNPNIADADGWTALHYATAGDTEHDILETLLRAGANPNAKDNFGETPFFFVTDVISAKILMDAGAHYGRDEIDNDGDTVLHCFSSDGRIEVVHFLVTEANGRMLVNIQNKDGNTPLHEAVEAGSQGTVEVLLEHGFADPTILNDSCQSAIDLTRDSATVTINPVYKLRRSGAKL